MNEALDVVLADTLSTHALGLVKLRFRPWELSIIWYCSYVK